VKFYGLWSVWRAFYIFKIFTVWCLLKHFPKLIPPLRNCHKFRKHKSPPPHPFIKAHLFWSTLCSVCVGRHSSVRIWYFAKNTEGIGNNKHTVTNVCLNMYYQNKKVQALYCRVFLFKTVNKRLRLKKSVYRLVTGWTVRGSNPDWPWGPISLLYNGYQVIPWGKAAGAWC
jgi:hypothetical protein